MQEPRQQQSQEEPRRGVKRRRALRMVGAGVYQLTIRLAVNIATAVLFVYFAVNSSAVAHRVSAFASEQVPGTITVQQIQWGPDPGRVRLIKPVVADRQGHEVLSAEWIGVEMSWLGMVRHAMKGHGLHEIRLRELVIAGAMVALQADESGQLRLSRAFSKATNTPPAPPSGEPFALIFDAVRIKDSRFLMDLNGTRIELAGVALRADFRLEISGPEAGRYSYNARDLRADHGVMRLQSFADNGLAQLPGGAIAIARMRGDERMVRGFGLEMTTKHSRMERGDMVVQLDAPGPTPGTVGVDVQITNAALTSSTSELFVRKLLGPTFAATARVTGDVHVTTAGASHLVGQVTGSGKMAGFLTRTTRADVVVDVGDRDDEVVRIRAKNLLIEAFGGELQSKEMRYVLKKDGQQHSIGHVRLQGISVAEALTSEAVGMTAASVVSMAGQLDGELETDVQLRIEPNKDPPLTMISKVGGVLTLHRATAAKQPHKEPPQGAQPHEAAPHEAAPHEAVLLGALPTLYMRGEIDTIMTPHSSPPRPLVIDLAQVLLSDHRDADGMPKRSHHATWLFADGAVDLSAQTLELRVDANVPHLGQLVRPFAIKGIDGAMRLDDIGVTGPWLSPTVVGDVALSNLLAAGQKIRRLTTRLKLGGGKLTLAGLRAEIGAGRIQGELELDLYDRVVTQVRKHIRLRGRRVDVSGLNLGELLKPYKINDIKGTLQLNKVDFEVDLSAPLPTLTASAHVHIARPTLRHERLLSLDADVRFGKGRIAVQDFSMTYLPLPLEALAARLRPPTVTIRRLGYGLTDKRFWLEELVWPKMALTRIGEVAVLKMPLHGTMAMHIKSASGTLKQLAFDMTLQFQALAWDKIYMGEADITLQKEVKKSAVVRSKKFFKRFELVAGSRIHFTKLTPMWLQLFMTTKRLDPMLFLGLPPLQDMRMLATGRAEFRLDFRPGRNLFSVHTELPKGGAELELGNGLEPVSNLHPATVDILPDRVTIGSMSMKFGRDVLEMCGDFFYPNEKRKRPSILQMYLAGTLDVPRFGALAESMASLDMRLRIDKDAQVDLDRRSRCLKTAAARQGILRIVGPLDALAAQGRLRLLKSRMTPRGYGKEIVLAEGAKLELNMQPRGLLTLKIPVESRLEGQIEEGHFSTWGNLRLRGYVAQDMNWEFDATDLAHTVPKEYSVVTSMRLKIIGTELADEKRRDLKVSGKVKITEGTYSKSFDRLGKVISGVRGRELDAYSEPLIQRLPWVGRIGMDLKVDGSNFLVLSRFPFGKTDLELSMNLKVKGTFAQPLIYDRVVVEPGSVLTYSVVKRDFEVTRGTIDFRGDPSKGVLDLEAKDDVALDRSVAANANSTLSVGPNLAGTSSSGYAQKVTVIIRVSGPLDDPSKLAIDFSSVPPYQQGDIQSLILTGQLLTGSNRTGSLGSRTSINFLTDDLAKVFSDMLLSAFVDKVSIGIPVAGGGITATVTTTIGKYLTLRGEYYPKPAGREMTGRFAFLLPLEGLYLESLLVSRTDSNNGTSNIFEGRVRFRLTLED